jgi:hypothetical protein
VQDLADVGAIFVAEPQLPPDAGMAPLGQGFCQGHGQAVEIQVVGVLAFGKQALGIGGGLWAHRNRLHGEDIY